MLIFLFSEIEKVNKESYKNQKGQSRMDNQETLPTLGTAVDCMTREHISILLPPDYILKNKTCLLFAKHMSSLDVLLDL
jgi:hypothetical protein